MIPNQAYGYSRKNCRRWVGGISWRHMLRDPSAPTRYRQRTSCAAPPSSVNRMYRRLAGDVGDRGVADAEPHVPAGGRPGRGQIREHRRLRVEPHRGPDEVGEVDAVAAAGERQLDCPRARRPRAAPGRRRRFRPAAGRCRVPGCRRGPSARSRRSGGCRRRPTRSPSRASRCREHQAGGTAADDAHLRRGRPGRHQPARAASRKSTVRSSACSAAPGAPRHMWSAPV